MMMMMMRNVVGKMKGRVSNDEVTKSRDGISPCCGSRDV